MTWYPTEKDFGLPHKTFNDLKDGDKVFLLNYKTLEIVPFNITGYEKNDASNSLDKNRFKPTFSLKRYHCEDIILTIPNGNVYMACLRHCDVSEDNLDDYFILSDEELTVDIKRLIELRNEFQWNTFTGLFGNPMSGYAKEPVILG